MPIGEIETHPYLEEGYIQGATKLILGSFPVYECTDGDSPLKQAKRLENGSCRFFYGSGASRFWQLYRDYVDSSISLPRIRHEVMQSLSQRGIAISDTITKCERIEFSPNDGDLRNKEYNVDSVRSLILGGTRKIICTSKGVLADLEKRIISQGTPPWGEADNLASCTFQNDLISSLGGNNNQIKNPVAKVFIINDIRVTALAIPSPGSSHRKLADFGFSGPDRKSYANDYFEKAFRWLLQ